MKNITPIAILLVLASVVLTSCGKTEEFEPAPIITTEKTITEAVTYKYSNLDVLGAKIGLLGNIGPELSDDQLENLGILDILILPVGGNGYTLDATSAAKIARNSDAKVIIPVHYAEDGINYEVPQNSLDIFIKELGADVEKTSKYKVKNISNFPEKMTIVHIERTK